MAQWFRGTFARAYRVIEVTAGIVERAMDLAETRALRGYDAGQLATAVEIHHIRQELGLSPITFVSADENLNEAARAEGLLADNPNVHR